MDMQLPCYGSVEHIAYVFIAREFFYVLKLWRNDVNLG